MELGIAGRPALVAAASRGLGRAAATSLGREGARVAICSRDRGAIEAARDEIIAETGADIVAIVADVGTAEGAVGFVREAADALGGCQILVTNAGGPTPGLASDAPDADWLQAFELNFLSMVRMVREAVPLMRQAGYGRVVAVNSLVVKQPEPSLALSNSVRLAAVGFLRTLVGELGPDGITVNAVLPHSVLTDRHRQLAEMRAAARSVSFEQQLDDDAAEIPLRRLGDPREVGDLVAFLAGERAAFVNGTLIAVDGGRYRGVF